MIWREREGRGRECSEFYLVSACATLHLNFELAQWPRPVFITVRGKLVKITGSSCKVSFPDGDENSRSVGGKANPTPRILG